MSIEINTEKLSLRERFLEAIVQSAIDYAIISTDLHGIVTSWNEGAHRILGWSSEEMVGRPVTTFFANDDCERGVAEREMKAALDIGRGSDERWHLRKDGSAFWASGEIMTLRSDDNTAIGFIKILRDRTNERQNAERQRLLMHELSHRLKNTLSVVQSIATNSLRNAATLEEAAEKLHLRIAAYSKAHEILLQEDWASATLHNLVEAAKLNLGLVGSTRIRADGPRIELGPQAALSFSMVLHELMTNASKYGALSNADGFIEMKWSVERRDRMDVLLSSWKEVGGPEVAAPERKGFGSRLVLVSLQAYGDVSVAYERTGVYIKTEMPLSRLWFENDSAIEGL